MEQNQDIKELPKNMKTIKVDVRTWNTLKNMKKENETFDDTIRDLLGLRTQALNLGNVSALRYVRKTAFFELLLYLQTKKGLSSHKLGVEVEYNDIKSHKQGFTIDLKIRKIFSEKSSYNPTIFFGIDHEHKHLSKAYLQIYLQCVYYVLKKELNVYGHGLESNTEDFISWRKIYYDMDLSEDSFHNDIEEPLRLSEEEKITSEYKKSIEESKLYNLP